MSEKCGCKIVALESLWCPRGPHIPDGENFIISYCSLHAAAEKMRDALLKAPNNNQCDDDLHADYMYWWNDECKPALAAAQGEKP